MSTFAVINASDGFHDCVAYVSGQFLLKWNPKTLKQSVMLELNSTITIICHHPASNIIAVADSHATSPHLVLWDLTSSEILIKMKLGRSLLDLDFSDNGHYLAAIEEAESADRQRIIIWDLFEGKSSEIFALNDIRSTDLQNCIKFNHENANQLITNGNKTVHFWQMHIAQCSSLVQHPAVNEFQTHGRYTVSSFMPCYCIPYLGTATAEQAFSDGTAAITATSYGDMVLWKWELSENDNNKGNIASFVAAKSINVHPGCISFLKPRGQLLVVGCSQGSVSFIDLELKLVSWRDDFGEGCVMSVAFSSFTTGTCSATDSDFVVGTDSGEIYSSNSVGETGTERTKLLKPSWLQSVTQIDVHPRQSAVAAIYAQTSLLQILDSKSWSVKQQTHVYNRGRLACLRFFRDGSHLCVGHESGEIDIYDEKLTLLHQLRDTKLGIRCFSVDAAGAYLAGLTCKDHLLLYRSMSSKHGCWEFRGRADFDGNVNDVHFFEDITHHTRLLALLSNGKLVEIDLDQTDSETDKLITSVKICTDISGVAFALSAPRRYYEKSSTENDVLISGLDGKLRQRNLQTGDHVFMHLSPLGVRSVRRFGFLQHPDSEVDSFMWSVSSDGYFALTQWPQLTPFVVPCAYAVTPDSVESVHISNNGRHMFVFTTSGTVQFWRIKLKKNVQLNSRQQLQPSEYLNDRMQQRVTRVYDFLNGIESDTDGISLAQLEIGFNILGFFSTEAEVKDIESEFKHQSIQTLDSEWSGRISRESFISALVRHFRLEDVQSIRNSFLGTTDGEEETRTVDLMVKLDTVTLSIEQELQQLLYKAGLEEQEIENTLYKNKYVNADTFLKWLNECR